MTNPFDGQTRPLVAGAGASLALLILLQSAFGGADSIGARFADAFLMSDDVVGVDELAGRVGMRGRELRRTLRAGGLPGPVQLSGNLRIVRWLWVAETGGRSLSQQMLASGADPSVAYRLVRTRTGLRWKELLTRGTLWFVETVLRPSSMPRGSSSKGDDRRLPGSRRRA